jgi:O-antigen/teichoic acid export membrane protein
MRKYQHLFDTEHLKQDLKNKTLRGGIITTLATGVSFSLRLVSTVLFARMLMPEHFGLIGMVTALTVVAEQFKDLGLSLATVQRADVNHDQVSTLFWINTGIGALITLSVAVLSAPIAWFYADQRLIHITLALSSSFFFSGLAVQHQALLRRQMLFTRLAWIQVLSNLLSVVVGIIVALQGFGYWALVWKEVARSFFTACGMWFACRWLPGMPIGGSGVGKMLRFGRDVTGFNIINFFSRSLDHVLIGKLLGAVPLGFYRQASQLVMIPISFIEFPVSYVAEPTFSALQGDPDKYRHYYRKIVSLVAFISMPMMIFLCVFSENIVLLLLGEKWIEAAPIFRVLALAAFIQPVSNTRGFVMVTCGKTQRYFRWGVISNIFVIASFIVGIKWGPIGVATAYTAVSYIIFVPALWYNFRETPITVSLFFEAVSLPVFASIIMALQLLLFQRYILFKNNIALLTVALLVTVFGYLSVWFLFPGGKLKLSELVSYPYEAFKQMRLARSK